MKETILIVDDSHVNRVLLENLLSGYEILKAADSREMWTTLDKLAPSLILMDVVLPDGNGFQLAKQLSQMEGLKDIPIIFVTSRNTSEDVKKGFDAGGYDYVKIPFDSTELLVRVRSVLEKKRLERKIREEAIKDSLTGTFNRRYLAEAGQMQVVYALRNNTSLTLIILDIDRFKRINDNYGHPAGDFILKKFFFILKNNLRPYDLVARYGGDEFVVIIPGGDKDTSIKILQRIKDKMNNSQFIFGKNKINYTFSAGICDITEIPPETPHLKEFVRIADEKLYRAKNNGRNQIIS